MLKTVILAAGQGTRMKSKLPKVLQKVNDKYLLAHVIDVAKEIGSEKVIVVIGHQAETVKDEISKEYDVEFVYQTEQLGTANAVSMANDYFDNSDILVLCGDTPLLQKQTLKGFIDLHKESGNAVTGLSMSQENPFGYGRIKRDEDLEFLKIVEQKDCSEEETSINEVNTGVYVFNGLKLKDVLTKIKTNNAQKELYLTDSLEILKSEGEKVEVCIAENADEFIGINDKVQLAQAETIFQKLINEKLMRDGVIIKDPNTTYISKDAVIGMDTVILPNTTIKGNTVIGEDCIIGPNTVLSNMKIKDSVTIDSSKCVDSSIGSGTTVGPFAYIRPKCEIGEKAKIGDFVEVKNAKIGNNTKASHLTYIGDAELGDNINLGCGTITVNYDGKNKFKTVIKDNAFIGCNSNLVAPVTIEENVFVAAGTTVTKDVEQNSLVIGRSKEIVRNNWRKFK